MLMQETGTNRPPPLRSLGFFFLVACQHFSEGKTTSDENSWIRARSMFEKRIEKRHDYQN